MESNGTRIAALLVTLAVIVGLFFVFRGPGDDGNATTTTPVAATTKTDDGFTEPAPAPAEAIPVIAVAGGEPKGGVTDLEFDKGDRIRFDVTADATDSVHVHGYDIEKEIGPGEPTRFDFPADLDGVFEIELHHSGAEIAELTVNP